MPTREEERRLCNHVQPARPSARSKAMSTPNTTLYIKNLNDHIQKEELRAQLYSLFTTFGRIIDVIALKNTKMRGQAFLVFADLASATAAMRACEGMSFYEKPMVRLFSISFYSSLTGADAAYRVCENKILCYSNERRPQLCPPCII